MVKESELGTQRYVFIYDNEGNPHALYYYSGSSTTPTKYYYVLNLQGDVVQLRNSSYAVVANYTYDAWGKLLGVTSSSGTAITSDTHIANVNPIRYRGYFYDTETKLYYCNSRYYDPQIKRFINADDIGFLGINNDYNSYNLYAYCGNNPIVREDTGGYFWNTIIGAAAGAIVGGVTAAIKGDSIKAGIVSGALSGAATGAALDITIATGGVGLGALAGVAIASGFGGSASSYVNQRMNGVSHSEVDWETVAIDGVWGAIGGAISFGVADVGGPTCQTLKQIVSKPATEISKQAVDDLAMSAAISVGTWLNGSKMASIGKTNMLYKRLG